MLFLSCSQVGVQGVQEFKGFKGFKGFKFVLSVLSVVRVKKVLQAALPHARQNGLFLFIALARMVTLRMKVMVCFCFGH